jgi:hypothetical protein
MPFDIAPAVTLVVGAGAAYVFTKWREREAEWRKEKIEVYREFVTSLSDFFLDTDASHLSEKKLRFVRACNNLNLVAPQAVIEALKRYHVGRELNRETFGQLISQIFYEIRRDLKISPKDDSRTFGIQVWLPPADDNKSNGKEKQNITDN